MPTESPQKESLQEFIAHPDTVAFNYYDSADLHDYVKEHPYIRIADTIPYQTVIMYAPEEHMDNILHDFGYVYLDLQSLLYTTLDTQALDATGITAVHSNPYLDLYGRGVLIGLVDTGIDYTQNTFKYEDGTSKIKYIWDQTQRWDGSDFVNYGAVYTQQQINAALKAETPFDVVPQKDESGHGTFLASVAAGRQDGDFVGAAPDAEIVSVKLRKANPYYLRKFLVPETQEDVFESIDIMLGLEFLHKVATALNRPLVVCFALGTNYGAHNGSDKIETYMQMISRDTNIVYCLACGNEGRAQHHVEGKLEKVGSTAPISVQVGERASSFTVYLWYANWDRVSISIRSPTGEAISGVDFIPGSTFVKRLVLDNSTIFIDSGQRARRVTVIRVINTPPGIWEITLTAELLVSGEYYAWMPITGLTSPDVRFLNSTPHHTVVIPCTGVGTIVTNAYDALTGSLYIENSWGPTVSPRIAPTFAAPGVNISGIFPYGPGAMSGTSVAAAVTAGACALMMQWAVVDGHEPSMDADRLQSVLIRGCDREPEQEYPDVQWGYGKLDLNRTLAQLTGESSTSPFTIA